jgi:capsular polysaccharide export protein
MTAYHVGFSRRKARFLAQFAQEPARRLTAGVVTRPGDRVFAWGDVDVPAGAASVVRVEDGFLRSVGLGAAFAQPLSWVFDDGGLHHEGESPSRLEQLIRDLPADAALQARAGALIEAVRQAGLTKYNVDQPAWRPPTTTRPQARRLVVVGQVADDAAVRSIATPVRGNMDLLRAVREGNPDAFILYRRHPDVAAGLRDGADAAAPRYADEVASHGSVDAVLAWADEVHVMNSLFGFEALLRGSRVVCHATPFYAGWGLTHDRFPAARRQVPRTLEQVVAAALILYPRYRDPASGRLCTPEAAVRLLVEARARRAMSPRALLADRLRWLAGRVLKVLSGPRKAGT